MTGMHDMKTRSCTVSESKTTSEQNREGEAAFTLSHFHFGLSDILVERFRAVQGIAGSIPAPP